MKNNTLFMDNYTKNNDTLGEHVFVLEYVYLANYFFVIEAIPIVPILFGNSLILFSIARFRRLRTRMNILVANLINIRLSSWTYYDPLRHQFCNG